MIQGRFNNDFDHLLGKTIPLDVAVAVSGGVDSVALLYLVSGWARLYNINVFVFSVNHNLRADAAEDILHVQTLAKKLGHKFFEFHWHSGDNKSSVQERARQARYDLMSDKCHEIGIDTILTAHHFDDMLETYLMRKSKKSGVFGLSSSASYFHNNIRVLRPLFNFSKQELVEYLQAQNIQWREDSSNQSDLYERNRLRKQISLLSNEGKIKLQNEMKEAGARADLLNEQLLVAMAESMQLNNYGFAKIDLNKLKNYCQDVQIQILNYVLTIVGGKTHTPRFRNTEKLFDKLKAEGDIKCSLHGCILKNKSNKLWVFRERASISNDIEVLEGGQFWDNRFVIPYIGKNLQHELGSGVLEPMVKPLPFDILDQSDDNPLSRRHIGRLSFDEYLSIKDKIDLSFLAKISDNNHKLILFTLPVIKNIEKVVAIPHISYYDGFDQEAALEIVFRPNFISRFTHFL